MDLRSDTELFMKRHGLTRADMSFLTGVPYPSFCRFLMKNNKKNATEKIAEVVYQTDIKRLLDFLIKKKTEDIAPEIKGVTQ